jgi:hypothetical protein
VPLRSWGFRLRWPQSSLSLPDISPLRNRLTSSSGGALAAILLLLPLESLAQSNTDGGPGSTRVIPSLVAGTLSGEISIDGRLDDAAWASAPVASGFIQRDPVEGDPAVHDTQVRVLIGPDAIYIGARMLDSEPPPHRERDDSARSTGPIRLLHRLARPES